MRRRLRLARAVSSTWYAILYADLVEDLPRGAGAAVRQILQALADAFGGTGLGRQVEQVLVRFSVLHHGGGPAVHRQDDGTFGLPEMAHELRRVIAEGGHGLNVFGDVHRRAVPAVGGT
jgi:hypothetical protein